MLILLSFLKDLSFMFKNWFSCTVLYKNRDTQMLLEKNKTGTLTGNNRLNLKPLTWTITRPGWWRLQISCMLWSLRFDKTYTTMPPSGSTPHHSNMLLPEEGVCLLNLSCMQHILEFGGNKWKLSNGDILTLEPWKHSICTALSCHADAGSLLGGVSSENYSTCTSCM